MDEKHRGNRLSARIVVELLKKNAANLFATTDNDRMKILLKKPDSGDKAANGTGKEDAFHYG